MWALYIPIYLKRDRPGPSEACEVLPIKLESAPMRFSQNKTLSYRAEICTDEFFTKPNTFL